MLTRKQFELLQFLDKRWREDGVSPSFEEMREALQLKSKSGVHRLISALEERGFIRRLAHRARAVEVVKLPATLSDEWQTAAHMITPKAPSAAHARPGGADRLADSAPEAAVRKVPVMGRIAAGTPIEAISEVADHLLVPSTLVSGQARHFALEVRGDSMIEAGINDGDIVIIREQNTADNGDIVVALIDGQEATLKRFRRVRGMIALEAANPAYETRLYREEQVQIQGRLVGLIRSY